MPQATRSLRRYASFTFFLYLVLATALNYLPLPWRLPVSLVNGLVFVAIMLLSSVLLYRRLDEFQRILLLRAFTVATFATMAFAVVWGHLQLAGGLHVSAPPALVFPVLLLVLTTAAKVVLFRRNAPEPRTGAAC